MSEKMHEIITETLTVVSLLMWNFGTAVEGIQHNLDLSLHCPCRVHGWGGCGGVCNLRNSVWRGVRCTKW